MAANLNYLLSKDLRLKLMSYAKFELDRILSKKQSKEEELAMAKKIVELQRSEIKKLVKKKRPIEKAEFKGITTFNDAKEYLVKSVNGIPRRKAAAIIGVSSRTLYNWRREYENKS